MIQKADSKVLSGLDLRDALDPLDDQTYYFSAVRSYVETIGVPIGVTPRRSSIWAGTTKDWPDFRETVEKILEDIEAVALPQPAPLPVLARPIADPAELAGAFDVSLQPPELLADDPASDSEELQELEKWGFQSQFIVTRADGRDFSAQVFLERELLGTIQFNMEVAASPIRANVSGTPSSRQTTVLLEEAMRRCSNPRWLKVRYDSGHTLSDGVAFEMRFRDMPFPNFSWVDLAGFRVLRPG